MCIGRSAWYFCRVLAFSPYSGCVSPLSSHAWLSSSSATFFVLRYALCAWFPHFPCKFAFSRFDLHSPHWRFIQRSPTFPFIILCNATSCFCSAHRFWAEFSASTHFLLSLFLGAVIFLFLLSPHLLCSLGCVEWAFWWVFVRIWSYFVVFFFSESVSFALLFPPLRLVWWGVRAIWLLVPFSSIILISIGSYLFALSLSHHLEWVFLVLLLLRLG